VTGVQPRFRLDGHELDVDLRASLAALDDEGVLHARVVAARPAPDDGPPPVLHLPGVPVRFDGTGLRAVLDDELRLLHDAGLDLGDDEDELAAVTGAVTVAAGDRLHLVGTVRLPDGRDAPLDVAVAFGGRGRRPAI